MIHSANLPDIVKVHVQTISDHLLQNAGVSVDVLRLDKIHTIISGNKWFKLKYYLQQVSEQRKAGIVTFGGAYSNHLIATAYSCKLLGISSVGVVRGEEPPIYSPTLRDVQSYGMKLDFVARTKYHDDEFITQLKQTYQDFIFIEEGGRGDAGIKGAEEILQLTNLDAYSHIMCAVGTGTMMTGIINSSLPTQRVIGVPVLKMTNGGSTMIEKYVQSKTASDNFEFQHAFHFGGYAKKKRELIEFMNAFYDGHSIPTDFVYTGKLFFAAMKLIEDRFFTPGANILVIHSGGLQGNRSLPTGELHFTY